MRFWDLERVSCRHNSRCYARSRYTRDQYCQGFELGLTVNGALEPSVEGNGEMFGILVEEHQPLGKCEPQKHQVSGAQTPVFVSMQLEMLTVSKCS